MCGIWIVQQHEICINKLEQAATITLFVLGNRFVAFSLLSTFQSHFGSLVLSFVCSNISFWITARQRLMWHDDSAQFSIMQMFFVFALVVPCIVDVEDDGNEWKIKWHCKCGTRYFWPFFQKTNSTQAHATVTLHSSVPHPTQFSAFYFSIFNSLNFPCDGFEHESRRVRWLSWQECVHHTNESATLHPFLPRTKMKWCQRSVDAVCMW